MKHIRHPPHHSIHPCDDFTSLVERFTSTCSVAKGWKQKCPGNTQAEKIRFALDELETLILEMRSHPEFSR